MLCDRVDVSLYLANRRSLNKDTQARLFGEGGPGRQLLEWFERWDIADERWHAVAEGGFAMAAPFVRDDGSSCRVALTCTPNCFMMPWEGTEPLAAKSYPKLEARLFTG